MDMSKNSMNRIQPTIVIILYIILYIVFNNYIKKLYILFNLYIKHIVHKENICNTFLYILNINNVNFKYCDICVVTRKVVLFFIKNCLKST